MLVLTRNKNTAVRIGDDILITVREFRAGEVTLEVDYPSCLPLKGPGGPVRGALLVPDSAGETPPPAAPLHRASLDLRQEDEFRIGEEIMVKIVALQNAPDIPYRVRLGFQAPVYVPISRPDHKEGGCRGTVV